MDVPVYNMQGDQVGTMLIDEQALGGTVNPSLIKQAYVRYHANLRQGSKRTKNRAMVSSSKRKMYRQKGTGRARHGTRQVAQFKGGGRAFNETRTREDYRKDMPKKMRRKANRNALLAKLIDNEVRILDAISFETPKTSEFVAMLAALKLDRKALVALSPDRSQSDNARRSGRNVEDATLCRSDQLTCFEMLNHRYLVVTRDDLQAWLDGPSSQTDKAAKVTPMGATRGGEG